LLCGPRNSLRQRSKPLKTRMKLREKPKKRLKQKLQRRLRQLLPNRPRENQAKMLLLNK
jgi:hypothetical protein